jgi:hypothetical protein
MNQWLVSQPEIEAMLNAELEAWNRLEAAVSEAIDISKLRHSREITRVCSPGVTLHLLQAEEAHAGFLLYPFLIHRSSGIAEEFWGSPESMYKHVQDRRKCKTYLVTEMKQSNDSPVLAAMKRSGTFEP